MPSLADKIAFAQKYITTPDGEPFTLNGREWVLEQLWRPLDGFKLWPVDQARLCDSCAKLAGSIVEDYHTSDKTRSQRHASTGCAGLSSEPILIVAANLKRQSGKTFNTAAWALSRVFKDEHESISLLAGSEDQVGRLFVKNYKRPIENSKALASRCRMLGTRLIVDKKGSDLEILPTSMSSVGDTRTAVVIDECRVVPADIAVALVPTLFSRGGWQCPRWHVRTHSGVDDPDAPRKCTVCGAATVPWFGKALLLSSAGELTDSDADWFFEFVTYYQANPHPNVHVFASTETLNPKVSKKVVNVVADVFGNLESTRAFASIEAGNEFTRKGEEVVSSAEVKRCLDRTLTNMPTCTDRAVGFVDTSDTAEKTCLVILAEDSARSSRPWEYVYVPRLDWWWPARDGTGVIDEKAVEEAISRVLPLYPNLTTIPVDTRGRPWAVEMVKRLRATGGARGKRVEGWTKTGDQSEAGWDILEQRIRSQTIRLPHSQEILDEFRGVTKRRSNSSTGGAKVVDRDRRKMHKDITEALAICCYLATVDAALKPRGMAAIREAAKGVRVHREERAQSITERIQRVRAPFVSRREYGENSW